MLNRRGLLQGSAALAFTGLNRAAFAQEQPAVPIVFVHGDSDLAATWETQIWRFESNGYPRDRLFAISFTDPQARDDDTVAQPNRSSTEDQLRELTAFIDGVRAKTGAPKVAIVALSRCRAAVMRRANMSPPTPAASKRRRSAARPTTASSPSMRCLAANTTGAAHS
jgi:hypothetical protein